MNATVRKMSKIVDELMIFFFNIGSKNVQMDMRALEDGCELTLTSHYQPEMQRKIESLKRFLVVENKTKDAAMEELFWELAGVNSQAPESQLPLVGQMLDRASVEVEGDTVKLVLFKKKI